MNNYILYNNVSGAVLSTLQTPFSLYALQGQGISHLCAPSYVVAWICLYCQMCFRELKRRKPVLTPTFTLPIFFFLLDVPTFLQLFPSQRLLLGLCLLLTILMVFPLGMSWFILYFWKIFQWMLNSGFTIFPYSTWSIHVSLGCACLIVSLPSDHNPIGQTTLCCLGVSAVPHFLQV